uniref:THIF-type NAD/FAD binding fold domain-containing protein n=1 Tax=Cucumis melo TaxID=3656 RepID=A0A9I9CEF9_CUCME
MDGEELTEQETQLYDRQIRVWGADAQRRLSKAHILVCGMKGAVAEFCKNIVLAGIGSLTLVDNRLVTEEALSANFLIPPDESVFGGKTVAELCCDSLKDFNPMVRVSAIKGEPSSFDEEFLKTFDVIVVSCCSLAEKKSVNEKCRKLPKRVSFYTVDCRDSCVIERFEEAEGRNPGETSVSDLPGVLKLKKEICESQSLNEAHIPNALLERLVTNPTEFPPVCAIIGGILGQEVIKAVSGKGDPLKNFFYFDTVDGKGIIEDVSNRS